MPMAGKLVSVLLKRDALNSLFSRADLFGPEFNLCFRHH